MPAKRSTARNNSKAGSAAVAMPAPAKAGAKTRREERLTIDDLHVKVTEMAPRPQEAPAGGGRYVYGIIQGEKAASFGKIGMGSAGDQVYTLSYRDIAAVVSNTSVFIFDPTRENALAHEHVVETVMRTHTIIPMSFGTVFRTDDDIERVLRSIYASLKDVLTQMAGKLEFGLKVNWDRDQIIEELKQEDEEIRQFHQEIIRKHLQST